MIGGCELKESMRKFVEEINLIIRKQFSIVDEGRENIMKVTLNVSKGIGHTTKICERRS